MRVAVHSLNSAELGTVFVAHVGYPVVAVNISCIDAYVCAVSAAKGRLLINTALAVLKENKSAYRYILGGLKFKVSVDAATIGCGEINVS